MCHTQLSSPWSLQPSSDATSWRRLISSELDSANPDGGLLPKFPPRCMSCSCAKQCPIKSFHPSSAATVSEAKSNTMVPHQKKGKVAVEGVTNPTDGTLRSEANTMAIKAAMANVNKTPKLPPTQVHQLVGFGPRPNGPYFNLSKLVAPLK